MNGRGDSVNALDKETGNAATSPKIELRDAPLDPSCVSYWGSDPRHAASSSVFE